MSSLKSNNPFSSQVQERHKQRIQLEKQRQANREFWLSSFKLCTAYKVPAAEIRGSSTRTRVDLMNRTGQSLRKPGDTHQVFSVFGIPPHQASGGVFSSPALMPRSGNAIPFSGLSGEPFAPTDTEMIFAPDDSHAPGENRISGVTTGEVGTHPLMIICSTLTANLPASDSPKHITQRRLFQEPGLQVGRHWRPSGRSRPYLPIWLAILVLIAAQGALKSSPHVL